MTNSLLKSSSIISFLPDMEYPENCDYEKEGICMKTVNINENEVSNTINFNYNQRGMRIKTNLSHTGDHIENVDIKGNGKVSFAEIVSGPFRVVVEIGAQGETSFPSKGKHEFKMEAVAKVMYWKLGFSANVSGDVKTIEYDGKLKGLTCNLSTTEKSVGVKTTAGFDYILLFNDDGKMTHNVYLVFVAKINLGIYKKTYKTKISLI